jgi:hypothetical protein
MNDVVVYQETRLSAAEIRANVNLVQEVMKAVMQGPSKENPAGVHYGIIPGTPKPTLYKAGAEKLTQTFRLAPSYRIEDSSDHDTVRLRITCTLTHQTTGVVVADGIGSCSSDEEKYKWRKPVCNEEFEETPTDRRRHKWKSGQRGAYKAMQIRTEKADVENTILKMAAKRAFVAATLNATAASDIFTQDIEDLPEELRHEEDEDQRQQSQPVQQPRSKSSTPSPSADRSTSPNASTAGGAEPDAPLSEGEKNFLRRKMEEGALGEADLMTKFQKKVDDLRKSDFGAVKAWLSDPTV